MSEAPHSADYIHDERFDWWSRDFLRLLKSRAIGDAIATSLADFGVGEGHWSLGLLDAFVDLREVTGVDREREWCARSAKKYAERAPHIAYRAVEADASDTGLPGASFDIVTAQTLLMHSLAPEKIVAEMRRVAKRGGTILCVEPVNHLNWAQTLELTHFLAPAERAAFYGVWVRFVDFVKSRRGDQDIGLRLPTLLARAGLENIRMWSNDRVRLDPIETYDIDFLEEEMGRDWVREALAGAAIGDAEIEFVKAIVARIRAEKPRELDFVPRASSSFICVATAP
ncbi:class I SAM-dependent methyltransferase [Methylosinus sporium]|uniref:class I SAM-dependent methyltransferase n=1 Tax=Methylosinus sporium TaxID=428 RepID=UPI00383A1A50